MEQFIPLIIEALLIGVVAFIINNSLGKVSRKLDTVLTNQQSNEVVVAKIKKDVDNISSETQKSSDKLRDLETRVNKIEIDVSALNEFKKAKENV